VNRIVRYALLMSILISILTPTQAQASACNIAFKEPGISSTGTKTFKVIFVKFPDSQKFSKNYISEQTSMLGLDAIKTYFKDASYGKLKIKFDVHKKFITLPDNSYSYELWNLPTGPPNWREIEQRFHQTALASADPTVNFSKSDGVLFIPDPFLAGGPRIALKDPAVADGKTLYSVVYDGADTNQMIHEILHNFGLLDLYNRQAGFNSTDQSVEQYSIMSQYFGGTNPLGFEKYQLNWLTDKDVICHNSGTLKIKLNALTENKGTRLVLIPLASDELIGVEYRKSEKVDKYLGNSGILVYNVKSQRWPNLIQVQNGVKPIKKGTKNFYGINFTVKGNEVTITK
jgi:M6 family metalloprotease-like protein